MKNFVVFILMFLCLIIPASAFAEETETEADVKFIRIDKKLNVDCARHNLYELTNYFAENIEGFIPELFEIEITNHISEGNDYYTVLYNAKINDFETPYSLLAIIKDGYIEYKTPTFSKYDIEELTLLPAYITSSTYENEIKLAKEEATKKVPDYAVILEQRVTKRLDKDLEPMLNVFTVCSEEGGHFVLDYEYKLN